MFLISSLVVLFLMGRSRTFLDKDQSSSGGGQKEWVRGGIEEKPKMRVIFAKFPLLSKVQNLSHKLLVRHISNHQQCNWYAQNPKCENFQVILSSSSWSKTTLCILSNKYGFKIGNAVEKNKLYFDQEEIGNAMEKINSVLIFSQQREALFIFFNPLCR